MDKLNIKLKEKEKVQMVTTVVMINLMPEFTPFNRSLKKIYGDDFFNNRHYNTPDFNGVFGSEIEVFYGDTDGDILRLTRYPFITQSLIEMTKKILNNKKYENIGKISNLATRSLKLNARTKLKDFESWTPAQLKEAILRYNPNITIDLWKNNDGTTTAIYQPMKPVR